MSGFGPRIWLTWRWVEPSLWQQQSEPALINEFGKKLVTWCGGTWLGTQTKPSGGRCGGGCRDEIQGAQPLPELGCSAAGCRGKPAGCLGFPHHFWKFCFLLFSALSGGTGQNSSLWLSGTSPQRRIFYYLESRYYKLIFISLFSFSFEMRSRMPQTGHKVSM